MLCGLQAIHPASLRCNENKKKNLCAFVEDSKSEATFGQYKNISHIKLMKLISINERCF